MPTGTQRSRSNGQQMEALVIQASGPPACLQLGGIKDARN